MVATAPQLRRIELNLEVLASVYFIDRFSKEWETASLSELDEDEAAIARKLLMLLANGAEVSEDKLILVKLENGTPVNVYGASVFRESLDNDNLIVKFGNNTFPCTFDGTTLKVGQLTGEFVFTDKKSADGKPYQVLTAEFNPNDNPYTTYPLSVSVQKGLNLVKPMFKAALNNGGVAQFFNVPSSGGGDGSTTYNLQDLELGEYPIHAIHQYEKKDTTYGLYCYVIELVGGAKVWAKGGSQNQLIQTDEEKGTKANKRWKNLSDKVKSGAPYKLKITKKESYKKGDETKWSVTNVIMPGTPKELPPEYPFKVVEQFTESSNQVALPSTSTLSFTNQGQAIAWAIEQGLTEAEAKTLLLRVNPKSSKPDREAEFIKMVGETLRDTIQGGNGNTITVEAVASELDEDDIPG